MRTKISTWNVNGYRAILGKGFQEWVSNADPDIICLQEIKVQVHQLKQDQLEYQGYEAFYWNSAEKPGYSGVATFSKIAPLFHQNGMGNEEFDREGRLIITKYPEFTLINGYFPNGQRGQDRVDYKLKFYEQLLNFVNQLRSNGEEVVITGDFNTAHTELDLAHPKENAGTSGFLLEERNMVDNYLKTGLVDIFRQLYPEKIKYTWWTYITNARSRNIGWRIDYFLVSQGLVSKVEDVIIHDEVMGSDHCPVSIILN